MEDEPQEDKYILEALAMLEARDERREADFEARTEERETVGLQESYLSD
jgi:hypothetical protein